jgi:hypothetical protein
LIRIDSAGAGTDEGDGRAGDGADPGARRIRRERNGQAGACVRADGVRPTDDGTGHGVDVNVIDWTLFEAEPAPTANDCCTCGAAW